MDCLYLRQNLRYMPVHEIACARDPEQCLCWPQKNDCVGHLEDIQRLVSGILQLIITPRSVDDQLDVLESFVVLLCDRASREEKMNLARKQLSSQKSRRIEGPTQAALAEHIKRAAYQAGHIWAQMFVAVPNLPSPGDWRWLPTIEGGWEVKCRSFSHAEASRACRELIRCGVGGSANMRNHFFSVLVSVCVKDCETLRDVDDAV
jgi:hypothetical protein